MRLRLLFAFSIVALVSIAAVAIFARLDTAEQVRTYMFRGAMTGADEIVTALQDYHQETGSWTGVQAFLIENGYIARRGQRMGMMNQRIQVADAEGVVVADSTDSATGSLLSAQDQANASTLKNNRNAVIGYLLVAGGMQFQAGDETPLIARLNNAVLRASLVGGAIAVLLALVLSAGLIRPIQQLTRAAQRLSGGDLSQRVAVTGDTDVAMLARSFNQMAETLQHNEDLKRAMTADIAHELRTPLAVQRAQLEAMQDGVVALTSENLQTILEQTEILSRLVDDLRTLALAEAGELQLDKSLIDLDALAGRSADQFRAQAAQKNIRIHKSEMQTAGGGDAGVWADPSRIGQILNNLISNAIRYSNEGGLIEIQVSETADSVLLTVHDSGPGIPGEVLPYVFDRFYRGDRSRSRDDGGTGLGLAIARQIAVSHSGDLRAENHPAGGAIFTLRLPKGSRE